MGRAMASNREQQRLLDIEEEELAQNRHRARCRINSKMHQLRSEMYKVRVKTPSLDESINGVTLCGLSPEAGRTQVSSYYEIGKNGRLVKKRNSSNQTKAAASRQRPRAAHVPSTSEIQEKVTSFFERNKELFTPAQTERDGRGSSQSVGREADGVQDLDRPHTTNFGTNFRYVSPEKALPSAKIRPTRRDEPPTARQNAWTKTASTNPYQSFFKPDSASLRLAQQMVVVSRKLKHIQVRREEQLREDSLLVTAVEARQKARRRGREPTTRKNRKKPQSDSDAELTD